MKSILLLGLSLLFNVAVFGQVSIGKSKSALNLYVSSHKNETFDKLKNLNTIFIVPNSINDKEDLKATIKEIWTLNSIRFVDEEFVDSDDEGYDPYNNLSDEYVTPDNMVIRLIDNVYSKTKTGGFMGPGTRTVGAFITFKFKVSIFENIKQNKKGKLKFDDISIAEIFFTPNIRLRQEIAYSVGGKMKIGSFDKINEKHNEEAGFYNFDLGYIKNYFQELNRRLVNSENLKIEDGIEKTDKLGRLSNTTLIVPEWSLKKYNALAATFGKTRTAQELFMKYGHDYEVVSNDDLNAKILNGDDFYYLMHTQFNQKRIISIIHSVTGEIIYLDEDGGYNIKESDLKKLSKLIDQSS